jgi:hypothetical protein
MYESIEIAELVASWTSYGVTMPEDLAKFIEIFEAIRWTEVERPPVFDITAVTTNNAEDMIRGLADQLAVSVAPGGGLSVLAQAKRQVLDQAARNITNLAGPAVPGFIEDMTPEFDKHVAAYTEAVSQLPDEVTPEALVAAGADAVTAYATAQREAQQLNRFDRWVSDTGQLPTVSGHNQDPVLRILKPATVTKLFKLDEAHSRPSQPTLVAIDPVYFTAVKEGVEFGINNPNQARRSPPPPGFFVDETRRIHA